MQITDKCQICGKEYKYCNKCADYHNWREVACSTECYKIYLIITQHRLGICTAEETLQALEDLNITLDTIDNLDFNDITKNYIINVLNSKSKKTTKK